MSNIDNAQIAKALGDPTRMQIFAMLKKGKMCACKILDAFSITQPTLSYHMKMLTDSGLVAAEKDGKWMHYTISGAVLDAFLVFLSAPSGCVNGCCEGGVCSGKAE